MKPFKQFLAETLPAIDRVMISSSGGRVELYEGRKWIAGRFESNIGIDQPTHGRGQQHAHVYGRKGDELVVINFDGTASHGKKGRLHDDDAAALRARGWKVSSDNIVEWIVIESGPRFLIG